MSSTSALKSISTTRRSLILFVLLVTSVVLFNRSRPNKYSILTRPRVRLRLPRDSPVSERIIDDTSNSDESIKIQIDGYWKEVRDSFGLPPLPGSFISRGDTFKLGADNQTEIIDDVSAEEDGQYLRRLGRLNPTLHRRRLSRSSDMFPQVSEVLKTFGGKLLVNPQSGRLELDETPHRYPYAADFESIIEPGTYPDLFIAADIDRKTRTPLNALSASFRAIAARELKAHRGKHGKRSLRRLHSNP